MNRVRVVSGFSFFGLPGFSKLNRVGFGSGWVLKKGLPAHFYPACSIPYEEDHVNIGLVNIHNIHLFKLFYVK